VLETKLKEIGIKTIKLEGSGREVQAKSDLNLLRQIVKIIKEESPNIVHLNSSKVGFVGTIAKFFIKIENIFSFVTKKHYKIPTFVFTSHGWAFNENKRGVIWRSIYLLCYYVIIFGCEKIIAVSEKTKNDILLNKTIKEKIKVIYNGIEKFELLKREDAKNILKSKNKITILSIGELHRSKGYDVSLKGISLLEDLTKKEVEYRIVGSGEEINKLEKIVRNLELEDTVMLLGQIDNARNLIAGADIFLVSSRNENFPYVILEAGFYGVPIIATNVGGIKEIINDMNNGILIHKENPKEIAEAISYIINHKEKSLEMASKIKEEVKDNFSIEKMVRDTTNLYFEN
jgi:glycosyltransferase involved in cell wall biosynthesis